MNTRATPIQVPPPTAPERLGRSPRVYRVGGFLDAGEVRAVLERTADPDALAREGIELHRDETGFSCELPVAGHAVLEAIERRLARLTGLENRQAGTLRFRRYAPGEAHPPHLDSYEIGSHTLILTAMMTLVAPARGGETVFGDAQPAPLSVAPRAGDLTLWFGHRPDGCVDARSTHEGRAVEAGEKVTLTAFVYARTAHASAQLPGPEWPGAVAPQDEWDQPRFFLVTEDWLTETNEALLAACESRGIEFFQLDPARFDPLRSPRPGAGDMLYRAGTSLDCMRVEQLLHQPGVAVFGGDPLFDCINPYLLFERSGIRVPRTVHVLPGDREALDEAVESVGGLPVILKQPGGEGGVGIVRADSRESLYSMADFMQARPLLMEYFEHVRAYRLVVLDGEVIDVEARRAGPGDFRTNAEGNEALGAAEAPDEAIQMALAASEAIGVEFGGADVLENDAGELVLAEFNSPCYFADQQAASGVDIAGAIVESLNAKALAALEALSLEPAD